MSGNADSTEGLDRRKEENKVPMDDSNDGNGVDAGASERNDLLQRVGEAPDAPGVYLMKDADGKIIYVGKAKSIRKRLASYFRDPHRHDPKTRVLVRKIASFDTILSGTEADALMLESNLIKRHRPRYNVILKDDKHYPCLRLDRKEPYPTLEVVRKIRNDGALYFGPFTSPGSMNKTLRFIHKTFKLRKCRHRVLRERERPCLNCQMDGCMGPCCGLVDEAGYQEVVREVILFLKGRTPELIRKVRDEMGAAAEAEDFEGAARLRDKMFALERALERQVTATTDLEDRDVLGIARSPAGSVMTVLSVRGGYLGGSRHFHLTETLADEGEMVSAFIRHCYDVPPFVPREILIPAPPEDAELLEAWLGERRDGRVYLRHPQRGEKARLLALARENAAEELERWSAGRETERDILERLRRRLRLDRLPERIECFDNSTIQGESPVAGMVVFTDGRADPSAYRKFILRTVTGPDDYASMAEVLGRRYAKAEESDPYPDLLMVDGGKGQLRVATAVLEELGLDGAFPVIGIAKADEKAGETADKIYRPGRANPVNFGRDGDLLLFLQRIRDEAHRFAIAFHRNRRKRRSLTSVLDDVPGVGPRRKKALLRHFGGVKKIRAATLEELRAVPGISEAVAEAIRAALDESAT
jgi:excinuclease ABC subunit C